MGERVAGVAGRAFILAGVLLLVGAPQASAHPTGDLTVNIFTGIVVAPSEVRLRFALDMAELVTSYEMPLIDEDDDDEVSTAEADAYAERKAAELLPQQSLTLDGAPVALRAVDPQMELIEGTAGLPYLRLDVTYVGAVDTASGTLAYQNLAYPQADGWREVTAVAAPGRRLTASTVPTESLSAELRAYPSDAFENPLREVAAEVSFEPGPGGPTPAPTPTPTGGTSRPRGADGGFADLITRRSSLGVLALSLVLAAGFGILHALAPGHGKSLMAAYLVGSGARLRQAAGVGVAIALMHTGSVIGLFVIVRSFETVFPGATVYAWLGVAAGALALGLGLWMLTTRLRTWRASRRSQQAHAQEHEHGHPHGHDRLEPGTSLLSRPGLAALALAGGLVPSPGALLVLTASVAAGRTLFGLSLVVAFSLGLAAALTAIGTLAIGARLWTSHHLAGRLAAVVPIVGAAAVVAVGAFLVLRSVTQL